MLADIACNVELAAVAIAMPREIRGAPALGNSSIERFVTGLMPTFTGTDTLLQTC
jgi:hypothetical protein